MLGRTSPRFTRVSRLIKLCASPSSLSSTSPASRATRRQLRRLKTRSMTDESKSQPYVTVRSTPHPAWVPPKRSEVPYSSEVVQKDPSTMDGCYSLMISAIVPRPIAFVSSRSKSGSVNLAPFSYFNVMAHDPPVVCFSVCRDRGNEKDTLRNVKESRECVVSMIAEWFVEAANHTCGRWPYEMDEFEISGLTKTEAAKVEAPLVKESPFNMECKVIKYASCGSECHA